VQFLQFTFPLSGVKTYFFIPPLVAFGISFFTSMGGISGAFLLLPFQMSILGFTSPSVAAPDWLLGILFGAGGLMEMYLGARVQKYVPGRWIKLMLGAVIIIVASKYILRFWGS